MMMSSKSSKISDSTLWLLGKCYLSISSILKRFDENEWRKKKNGNISLQEWEKLKLKRARVIRNERILKDFYTRIWITYRKDFPEIAESSITSDAGWGCMLRTGQMLIAQGFMWHFLPNGRDWEFSEDKRPSPLYTQVLRWFADFPSPRCPYSIHNMLKEGKVFKKKVGEWHGPDATCFMLKQCHSSHGIKHPKIMVAEGGVVYWDQVEKIIGSLTKEKTKISSEKGNLETKEISQTTTAMILLIPVRLGADDLNLNYIPTLVQCLQFPLSLGIMGGRKRSSLYFVGYQNRKVIYLDPHTVQKTVPVDCDFAANSKTYHCEDFKSIPIEDIDPSLALGFYISDVHKLREFWKWGLNMTKQKYPIFRVAKETPNYEEDIFLFGSDEEDADEPKQIIKGSNSFSAEKDKSNKGVKRTESDISFEEEDYVLL